VLRVAGRVYRHGVRCLPICILSVVTRYLTWFLRLPPSLRVLSGPGNGSKLMSVVNGLRRRGVWWMSVFIGGVLRESSRSLDEV
jgi:hypothetical protein